MADNSPNPDDPFWKLLYSSAYDSWPPGNTVTLPQPLMETPFRQQRHRNDADANGASLMV